LLVYSEFARIDAKGKVTVPAEPREILSPALARNAWESFQIVVEPSDATLPWQLYVAQNPENAVAVTLYRESGDKLEKVSQPVSGTGVQIFWMDIYTAKTAPAERIKVEPQLHINNDWVIYPMEGRVMDAIVPDAPSGGWPQGVAEPGEVMRGFVCGTQFAAGTTPRDPVLSECATGSRAGVEGFEDGLAGEVWCVRREGSGRQSGVVSARAGFFVPTEVAGCTHEFSVREWSRERYY
jgi:hypothetical protein